MDKERSNERQVTLNDLSMKSTGRYRCEVSTEAPSFDTVSSFGDMIVVGEQGFKYNCLTWKSELTIKAFLVKLSSSLWLPYPPRVS